MAGRLVKDLIGQIEHNYGRKSHKYMMGIMNDGLDEIAQTSRTNTATAETNLKTNTRWYSLDNSLMIDVFQVKVLDDKLNWRGIPRLTSYPEISDTSANEEAELDIATTSPFTKKKIRQEMSYYFDDDRIAILELHEGEWKSLQIAIPDDNTKRLQIHAHSRFAEVTALHQDINKTIGLKYGLHLALNDYLRYRLEEDNGDFQKSSYYLSRFRERIKKYPYRRSAVRGIAPWGLG